MKLLYYILDEFVINGLLAANVICGLLAWGVMRIATVSEISELLDKLAWYESLWFIVGMVLFPFFVWAHLSRFIKGILTG